MWVMFCENFYGSKCEKMKLAPAGNSGCQFAGLGREEKRRERCCFAKVQASRGLGMWERRKNGRVFKGSSESSTF